MADSASNSDDKAGQSGTGSEKGQFLDVNGKPVETYPEGKVIRREIVKSGYAMDRVAYAPETMAAVVEDTRRLMIEDGFEIPFRPDHPNGWTGVDDAPLPSFGRMVNVEIEGEGLDAVVFGTISLNALGNKMVNDGLFPGVSWGLQPMPALRSGQVLRVGMHHLAALGASTGAYAALQRALPQAEPEPAMNDQSIIQRVTDFVRGLVSPKDIPVTEQKDKTMSTTTTPAEPGPVKREMPAAAVGELMTALGGIQDMLKEYMGDEEEEEQEEEEQEEEEQEEKSLEADKRAAAVEKQLAEARSLLQSSTWQILLQSGKVAPDQKDAFVKDVAELGLDRTVMFYERMNADMPTFGNHLAAPTGNQNQGELARNLKAAAEVLDMSEYQIEDLLPITTEAAAN